MFFFSVRLFIFFALGSLWSIPLGAQESDGYRLLSNQVQINRAEDWRAWDTPPGVQVVRDDATVEPRFLRSNINVTLDASSFIYVNPFV